MPKTIQKNIRLTPEQWNRIEKAARERDVSPNRLIVSLAMEALDRHDWPRTETEIRVARACLFTSQAIARDLIAAGKKKDIQEIRDFISTIVPDVNPETDPPNRPDRK
ncbi:MAG: hypothetical protein F4Y85_15460 [Gammaproteobacteria bacterium]|nr:hypothetical protein [Gammaproteobacteria bacterium]